MSCCVTFDKIIGYKEHNCIVSDSMKNTIAEPMNEIPEALKHAIAVRLASKDDLAAVIADRLAARDC